ncbi:hypothetical protein C5E05_07375 [Pseudoclavibacter sp. AY1H1]|nr:hypothetical protein C5E05_07375 [Pseudoclavibacter sp. AY1H1]
MTLAVPLTVTGPRSRAAGLTTIGADSPPRIVEVSAPVATKVAPLSTTVPVAPGTSVARVTVPVLASAPSVVNARLPLRSTGALAPTFAASARMAARVLPTSARFSSGTRPR